MILSGNFLFLFLRYIFFPFFTVVSHSEIAHFHLLFPTSSLPPWTELNNACARLHDVMWLARLVGDQLTINVFFFLSLFLYPPLGFDGYCMCTRTCFFLGFPFSIFRSSMCVGSRSGYLGQELGGFFSFHRSSHQAHCVVRLVPERAKISFFWFSQFVTVLLPFLFFKHWIIE